MSDEIITKRSLANRRRGQTDWARVDALTDADIEHAVAEDADAVPLLDADWFRTATLLMPPTGGKDAVALRVDHDVLEWFKAMGRGYQSRMNAVLRAYFEHERGNMYSVRRLPAAGGVGRVKATRDPEVVGVKGSKVISERAHKDTEMITGSARGKERNTSRTRLDDAETRRSRDADAVKGRKRG